LLSRISTAINFRLFPCPILALGNVIIVRTQQAATSGQRSLCRSVGFQRRRIDCLSLDVTLERHLSNAANVIYSTHVLVVLVLLFSLFLLLL
jgi:predicted RNA-binding Zn-ribbon protein involved in translation (DUF1610 family)